MDNLKQKTAKGLFWGALNNGSTQLLSLVVGVFLARLLTPSEYGVVGVLTIFTAVAGCLQASGFTQGLINLKAPTSRDYNSVFWFNMLASSVLYIILFVSAPLIARYFKQPCLVEVSRVVFLTLPVSALGIACNAFMLKNMMNKEIAIITFWALLLSGVCGICLAFNGCSYWSLVWQQLIYLVILNIGRFHYVRWRPSFPIDFGPVRQMFAFCVKLLVTNIINTLNQHLLTFFFGRLFPIHVVGNYSQANKWNTMAHTTVSGTLGQIAQAVLVSVSDERDRRVHVFRKLMRFTAFLSFPAMLGLALVAREFIFLTIGEKWADCVPLLQLLCISGAFLPFHVLYQNLIVSCGRSDFYMCGNLAQVTLLLAAVLFLHGQGIMAFVWTYVAITLIWMFVWHVIAHQLIGIRLIDSLKDIVPFMLIALAVMAVTWLLTLPVEGLFFLLIVRILVAGALYVIAMRLAHAKVMDECIRFVLRKD